MIILYSSSVRAAIYNLLWILFSNAHIVLISINIPYSQYFINKKLFLLELEYYCDFSVHDIIFLLENIL